MEKIKRYGRLYRIFIVQYLKSLMQSKVDFFVGLVGFFLTQIMGIIFLYLIFQQIPTLNNWTFEQLVFIYGFAQIPRGLDHLFTDNIWMIAWRMVISGEFDRYLLRPMNLFFQVVCEKFQPDAFGELLVGFILVGRGIGKGIVVVNMNTIAFFLVSMIAGTVIYTSIKLLFASLAFWFKQSGPFLQMAYEMADFAKYPVEIYATPIRFVITWILPFAFVAYLPATYFLTETSLLKTIGIECVIAIVFWIISYSVFLKGTKIYESAGN